MGRWLCEGSYASEGIKGGLREGGTGRRAAIEGATKALGGTVEAFYYAFGDTDVYIIVHAIDNETAAAFSMAVAAIGAGSVKTTVLMTPQEIDHATKKNAWLHAPGHWSHRRPSGVYARPV